MLKLRGLLVSLLLLVLVGATWFIPYFYKQTLNDRVTLSKEGEAFILKDGKTHYKFHNLPEGYKVSYRSLQDFTLTSPDKDAYIRAKLYTHANLYKLAIDRLIRNYSLDNYAFILDKSSNQEMIKDFKVTHAQVIDGVKHLPGEAVFIYDEKQEVLIYLSIFGKDYKKVLTQALTHFKVEKTKKKARRLSTEDSYKETTPEEEGIINE